jgi:hypothetical protein
MKQVFGEGLLSAGAVLVLLGVLVTVDPRVRTQLALRVSDHPAAELAGAGSRIGDLTSVIATAAREQSLAHAPLLIFGLAATVLFLLMLRT